jgi:hypothetical protein
VSPFRLTQAFVFAIVRRDLRRRAEPAIDHGFDNSPPGPIDFLFFWEQHPLQRLISMRHIMVSSSVGLPFLTRRQFQPQA